MELEDITEQIIGAAYKIHNRMGPGFLESVYERCLIIELKYVGLRTEAQKHLTVQYEGENVGDFIADLVVDSQVIVEIKAVEQLAKAHEVQLVNYLVATGIPVGLLINFGASRVEVKRKVRELPSPRAPELEDARA